MTLVERCEPLFQYICRLNRAARKGGNFDPAVVRSEIKALLAEARAQSTSTPEDQAQFEKIELPLLFFADFMIKQSALPFAPRWKELAAERNESAGDEKFFDLLEETLKDKSQEAIDRLAVFYTAMGLGFAGFYVGQSEFLRRKMKEMAARIQSATESSMGTGLAGGSAARICPDAYEHVDTRDLVEPPSTQLLGIGIALLGLVAVLFVANAYLYHDRSKQLSSTLATINDRAAANTPPSTPSTPTAQPTETK